MALVPDNNPAHLGAAVLDGELIEYPHVMRARRILGTAERLPR